MVIDWSQSGGLEPQNETPRIRAAEYVRMSTKHQRYSTDNQAEAIRRYADQRGYEIVRIAEVGVIEPPVVVRDAIDPDRFHLLDGHLRIDILRDRGDVEVVCLVATDDEAFTYNKRVSRIAIVQEHKMILNAARKGVPEERLARALNVNIGSIRTKQRLLDGICAEAANLLKDRHVPINTFWELKRMKPMRQIEVAELMIAMNRFSVPYLAKHHVEILSEFQRIAEFQKAA